MRIFRLVLPSALALGLAASFNARGPAQAAQDRPSEDDAARAGRDRVRALLPQVAGLLSKAVGPAEIARLQELGPEVDLVLIEIASDSARDGGERLAAVRALGRLATPVGRDYLIRLVVAASAAAVPAESARGAAQAAPDAERARQALARTAALSLGWMRAVEAVDALSAMLAHPDRESRLDAIAALALLGRHEGLAALELRLPLEKDAGVKKKLRQHVARLKEQLGSEKNAPPPRVQRPRLRPDGPIEGTRDPIRP